MTNRNPLVRIDGKIVELPAADTLAGAATGQTGATGSAATISVGTTTTGAAGSSASVSNSGTSSAAVFDFTIPRGDTGATGSTGAAGANGAMAQISQIVCASSQATVDFTSIPGTYNALKIVYFTRDTASGTGNSLLRLKVNNDGTSGNYTATFRSGTQNTTAFASSVAASAKGFYVGGNPNDGNTAGIVSMGEITIVGYASTFPLKRFIATNSYEEGTPNSLIQTIQGRWTSTAAITRLTFGTDGTAFKDGATFTLYGF